MAVVTRPAPTVPGRAASIAGYAVTGLVTLFLLFDSVTKLLALPPVVEATEQLGFAAATATVPVIGGTLLVCLVLHLVPRTAVLGAVLLTGYLGGAVCAQLRVGAQLWTFLLVPVYTGALVWLGLYLRSTALRRLVRGQTVSLGSANAESAPRRSLAALSVVSSTTGTRDDLRLARNHLDHEIHRP